MNAPHSPPGQIDQLKALAHPLRFQILELLKQGERNVGDIETASGIGQPALSQQLGILRKAGLVETRKDAKLVFYRRNEARLSALANAISTAAKADQTSASGGAEVDDGAQRQQPASDHRPSPGAANFARMSSSMP